MNSTTAPIELPLEIISRGNAIMLETMAWSCANDNGLESEQDSSTPETDFFRQLRIGTSLDSFDALEIGFVRLQSLPGDRTLMRFWLGAGGDEKFREYCAELIKRLARLGFIDVPDVPKDPIGFRPAKT